MFQVQRRPFIPLAALAILAAGASAQSTEALISGRITDVLTQQPIPGALVTCVNAATHTQRSATTSPDGLYALTLLPPGTYEIRISHATYQSKEQDEITLGVADSLDLNFSLRPLADLWESAMQSSVLLPDSSAMLNFHGPDVDPNHWTAFVPNSGTPSKLESSLSDAVSPNDILELPLNGDNIYAVLLAEPGVTADAATTRSLGIAANGQRASSSNFLLDGVEANFNLITGPIVSIPPEATQEYRLSTNNFSAEYGGAAGYIANTVTRSGGDQWHGLAYFDLENTILNANDFQSNLAGIARNPSHQDRPGAFIGGPIWKRCLFSGTSIEYFRSRSQMIPQSYNLPSTGFLEFLGCPTSTSYACQLLTDYPAPNTPALVGSVTLSQPISLNQWLGLQRFDYSPPDASQHITLRVMASNVSQPDFIWSPYPNYISGLDQPVENIAANWTRSFGPAITNQLSAGWNDERLSWTRANPQVPTLIVTGGNAGQIPLLPGSPAAYALDDSSRYVQLYDNLTTIRGRHILKFGAGAIWTHTDAFLGYGLGGEYLFCNILRFGATMPGCPTTTPGVDVPSIQFAATLARGAETQPDLARTYENPQYYAFAEDTFRITPRLSLELGLRLDYFGAPSYDGGVKDWTVQFGSGTTFDQRVANATLDPPTAAPSSLFSSGGPALAPRTGFAYNLWPAMHTTLRGGFGLFYDRLFDNLWLTATNNSFIFPSPVAVPTYLPLSAALTTYSQTNFVTDFPNLTAFQPHLHNAYAEDFFLGIETQPLRGLSLEINTAGSLGRRLITNDAINRNSELNTALPAMEYLSNQGMSDYYSLNIVTRWRVPHGFLQAAYTWSHAIDIQSDPLAGDYFNLDFANIGPAPESSPVAPNGAAFSTPNDSRADRASADFDQRQTFVFFSWWQIPRSGNSFLRRAIGGLAFSELGAIRSGFPYSIFTAISSTTPQVINAFARPLTPYPLLSTPIPVPGGQQIFEPSAFCPDDTCSLSPSGRNAFTGPGLINLDTSASRSFPLRWLGEKASFILRADAFNFLNHANLNPPGNVPGTPNYGIAPFGTPPQTAGFPSVVPLTPSARTIQLTARVIF
jgi:Carboxypeptidase regulatory-like domain